MAGKSKKKKAKTKKSEKKDKPENKGKKEEPKKSDKALIIGLLLVIGAFTAILLYGNTLQDDVPEIETVEYNGYVFEKHGTAWTSSMSIKDAFKGWEKQFNFAFHFLPQEVEDVETIQNTLGEPTAPKILLNSVKKVYITMDPDYPASVVLSGVEISKIIGKVYEVEVKASIIRESNKTDAPIITCQDLKVEEKIIDLRLGKRTGIYDEKGCIVVEGTDPNELLRAAQRLSFELLKIM